MSIPFQQAEVAALLGRLTGAAPILTHVSAVFVGAGDVFKLKQAVSLEFLDFSTLAARERFIRREHELNQGFAPGLYRGVRPVVRGPDGALRLGVDGAAPGEVVDWVLQMAPVPAGDFLDAMARRGAVTPALLDEIGDKVAAMHAALPPLPGTDAPAAMRRVLTGNLAAAERAGVPGAAAWAAQAFAWLDRLAPVLAARAADGRVRRCHGDLHLGNLCLWQGAPTPFDALEFDEDLAIIDTGYDLAFVLADLAVTLGRAAANRVLNRYIARTGDTGLVAALPLWLSARALIRAHVLAVPGKDPGPYMDQAMAALAPPPPPRLVAVGGLQGTGKSTLARAIAPLLGAAPGALVLRSDEIRKRLAGVAPEQRLPAESYTPEASAAVLAELGAQARLALAAGHSVVADAAFLRAEERAAIAAAAADFTGLWLTAPLDVLRARVAARQGDASDASVAVLEAAAARDPGPLDWTVLDATGEAFLAASGVLRISAEDLC